MSKFTVAKSEQSSHTPWVVTIRGHTSLEKRQNAKKGLNIWPQNEHC